VLGQIEIALIQLQRDLRGNAIAHRAMAVAQSPDLAKLQSFVTDCATAYNKYLQWVAAVNGDVSKTATLSTALTDANVVSSDVSDLANALQAQVTLLAGASLKTYADIIAACDVVIANVDAPISLWPE
jgi:hypothetical protein